MISRAFLLSVIFCIIWLGALYNDFHYQPRIGHTWYIYKLVMLTNLNFVLDVVYSVIVVLSFKSTKLKEVADFMFFTSVFPVGSVTCGLFWGLYAIEPTLVMPDWAAQLIPSWLNHVQHTLPVVYAVCDFVTIRRSAPNWKVSLRLSVGLVLFYFAIIAYVFLVDGFWLYPLLTFFSGIHFFLAFVVGVLGYFGLVQLAVALNKLRWGNVTHYKGTGKKNKTK